MKYLKIVLFLFLISSCASNTNNPNLKLYVFDCGLIKFDDISFFGLSNDDTEVRELFVPCYLVEHDQGSLLWDAGLPLSFAGKGKIITRPGIEQSYEISLIEQMEKMNIKTNEIDFIALSHLHSDHVGAATMFKEATWLVQEPEFEAAFSSSPIFDLTLYEGLKSNKRQILNGDFDVFGDGSVTILSAPGHTPGHQVLLLDLDAFGPLLLSGDLYHFVKSRELKSVPDFNVNAEQSLESMSRIENIIVSKKATLWIEHSLDLSQSINLAPAYYE